MRRQRCTRTKVRYTVLLLILLITTLNYADRATLSVTGSAMHGQFGLDAVRMGYIFSAFSWAYVLSQLPAGWAVVALMSLALLGKGIGALGWAVVADTSPKATLDLSGAIFNMFGNAAGIVTPIVIGYLVAQTGSFNGARMFVGANALLTAFSYLVIVKNIKRVELRGLRAASEQREVIVEVIVLLRQPGLRRSNALPGARPLHVGRQRRGPGR